MAEDGEAKPNSSPEKKSPPPRRHLGSRSLIAAVILTLLILAGIIILTLWLVYEPRKPHFRVLNVVVFNINTTSPLFISTAMQFTVVTRNPSKRTSIHYNHLSAILLYKDQTITPPMMLPPLVHDAKTTVAMSPVLGGSPVEVAAEVGYSLEADEAYGAVSLRMVIKGKVKFKGGRIWSRSYGMNVKCDVAVAVAKKGFVGELGVISSPPCEVLI